MDDQMKFEKAIFQSILKRARESILNFDSGEAELAVREAVDVGMDPVDLIEFGFIEGMKEMGDRYEKGDVPLGYIIAASKIMDKGLSMLKYCASEKNLDLNLFGNIAMSN